MIYPRTVLGIHSTRACGKDTLFSRMRSQNPYYQRFAFADALKDDLSPFILKHFGFNIWSCTPEQKELARPILIAYGCAQRAVDIDYWVNRVIDKIDAQLVVDPNTIPVVTDVRFESEHARLRTVFGSTYRLVNLTRNGSPPPTDEEEKHYRKVAAMADKHLHWGGDTEEQQLAHARNLMEWLSLPLTPAQQLGSIAQ